MKQKRDLKRSNLGKHKEANTLSEKHKRGKIPNKPTAQ